MKAKLRELNRKYYNSYIDIELDSGEKTSISISKVNAADFTPSERELAKAGFTKEEWDNNVFVEQWGDYKIPIREADIVDTSHFENESTYHFVKKIVEKLNDM